MNAKSSIANRCRSDNTTQWIHDARATIGLAQHGGLSRVDRNTLVAISGTQLALDRACRRHCAGDFDGASADYAAVLQSDPNNADAWHLQGLISFQRHQYADAVSHIERGLQLSPLNPTFLSNLAAVELARGHFEAAETHCRKILERCQAAADRTFSTQTATKAELDALQHLGTSLLRQNRFDEAIDILKQSVGIRPEDAGAWCNLGAAMNEADRAEEAVAALRCAEQLSEGRAEIHLNLGVACRRLRRHDEALRSLNRAIQLAPDMSEAYTNRGNLLLECHQPDSAVADYQTALQLNPRSVGALSGLSQALPMLGHWDEAMEAVRLASILSESSSGELCETGSGGKSRNQSEEVRRRRRETSAALKRRLMSNLLYCASLSPGLSRLQVAEMHLHWGRAIESSIEPFDHPETNDIGRRLRIGYVSPDFRDHATMRFFYPYFVRHDRTQFEFFLYSETTAEDATTVRIREASEHWRATHRLSDRELAEQICRDRIDILVDLAGHTSGNRLPCFAHRPAPVQVSFLGYPNTTGLQRVDYLLTDAIRENSVTASLYAETLVAMPNGPCCFQAAELTPDCSDPPFLRNGYVTLGSTHRPEKLSGQCLHLWANVLNQLPGARLRIVRDVLGTSEGMRRRLIEQLRQAGVDVKRVDLSGDVPRSHLEIYRDIDILLDVFPWPGGTTIYESLWMGVPMPAIAAPHIASCATASCLFHTGLTELIAGHPDEYPGVVSMLADSPSYLCELRASLRDTMKSTVCRADRFAADMESVFRSMWQRHCGISLRDCGLTVISPVREEES